MQASPPSISPSIPPSIIVTTVHGTFAQAAAWVKADSPFCASLRQQIGGEVVINPFHWSGDNKGAARLLAAQQLQVHLAEQLRLHPSSRHFVIAHSHGGNVALYAMRDPLLQRKLAGVVCLSTPFLTSLERRWSTRITVCFQIMVFFIPILLYIVPLFFLDAARFTPRFNGLYGLGFMPLMYAIFTFDDWLGKWHSRRLGEVRKSMQAAEIPALPLGQALIIRGTGDEAASALSTAQFSSFLFRKLLIWSDRLMDRLDRLVKWVYKTVYESKWTIALVIGFVILGLLDWLRPAAANWVYGVIRRPVIFFGGFFLGWVAILIGFGSLVAAVAVILGLVFLAFDVGSLYAGMFFDLSVEPSPPGQWLTYQLPPFGEGDVLANALRHSIYEHPLVPQLVCSWMKSR